VILTDKNEYHLKDNFVTYFPARLDYRRISKSDELIVIHFEATNYSAKSIEYFEPKDPDILARLFRDILECWNKKEIGYRLKCSALLYEILAECYAQNYKKEAQLSKIQASVDYINQSYKKSDLTIKEIADRSFMSEVYFRKLFKEEFGISPSQYIVSLRIQHAAGLISSGYYSLKEVAYLSGYNDYKYFSVEFKKAIGVSPSKYLYNYE
jgi:YesN/AraC family two-component response regulator